MGKLWLERDTIEDLTFLTAMSILMTKSIEKLKIYT